MLAALVPALLAAGFLGAQAAQAGAAPPSTLYVNQSSATCSDSGPGTQAQPFCTIQAAADVVGPGQTVDIEGGSRAEYTQALVITRSGQPSAPITFAGVTVPGQAGPYIYPTSGAAPVTIQGAHDVTVENLGLQHYGNADGVDVTGSSDVTLDRLYINQDGAPTAHPSGVAIDAASANVTVSRSQIWEGAGDGVRTEAGAKQITVTTNFISSAGGIVLNGTSGAAVTSNSVAGGCTGAIAISGASTAVVENNFAAGACSSGSGAALWVAAGSAGGVTADYNALRAASPSTEYNWGGVAYPTAAAFHTATGQGGHDLDITNFWPSRVAPPEGSALIDSADCAAPGELATDIYGLPHVRDPLAQHTGTGTCYADRGAVERQDTLPITYTVTPDPVQGTVPLQAGFTNTSPATSPWQEPVSYTVNFGDGGGPVAAPPGVLVSHTYATPGVYTLTVTAADTSGSPHSVTARVVAGSATPPSLTLSGAPEVIKLASGPALTSDTVNFTASAVSSGREETQGTIAFGDGTSQDAGPPPVTMLHVYPGPGTYTATFTGTDLLGRTSTARSTVTVGETVDLLRPVVDYSRLIGGHRVVRLSMAALHTVPTDVAFVNAAVTGPRAAGSLTVYPDGSRRPATASLLFRRGQSVSGQLVARAGTDGVVDFYNSSRRPARLRITTIGADANADNFGDTYVTDGPARVLATRPVRGGRSVTFPIAGTHGVPGSAAAVVLDVTATATRGAGFLTAYGAGSPNPGVRDVAWRAGQAVTGLVTVPLTDGRVVLHNASGGNARFLADLAGYYLHDGTGAVFLPLAGQGIPVRIGRHRSVRVRIGGRNGIPASGAVAVAARLAVSRAGAGGHITGYPDGAPRPGTAVVSFARRQPTIAPAVIPVAADGAIDLYNASSRTVHLTVVMDGFYYSYPVIP